MERRDNIIKLITNSQDRFHIPGEKLTATNVLLHQIPTTDDHPINTRQYRFPQIHKEEINRQVEELLEGGIVKQLTITLQHAYMDCAKKRKIRRVINDGEWS